MGGRTNDLTATMQIYLEAVIGPRTKLEDAGLLVEGEVLHVDLARWLIYGRRLPLDQSLMVDCGLRGQGHLEVAVRAASEHISGSGRCGGRAYFVLPILTSSRLFFLFNFNLFLVRRVYMCVRRLKIIVINFLNRQIRDLIHAFVCESDSCLFVFFFFWQERALDQLWENPRNFDLFVKRSFNRKSRI